MLFIKQVKEENFLSGDLHCHTRLSNGSIGIDDIIALAKMNAVEVLAITDHDCLAGNVRAKIIGDRNDIKIIPGVELSATDEVTDETVYILCYLADFPDRLEGLCQKNNLARKRASQYMMIKAAQRYPVSAELIKKCAAGSTNLYPEHIMHALMDCGLTDKIHGELWNSLFSEESVNNIFVKPRFASLGEVMEGIHSAGGIAVLSNPVSYKDETLIPRLMEMGLDGIEVWHPDASEEDSKKLYAFAKKNRLLMTGGTAFCGMYNKNNVTIGAVSTPKTQLSELMSYKSKLKRLAKKQALAAQE